MQEKSYVMVKPEFANYKEAITEIKSRIINAGLKIIKEGYVRYDTFAARKHYEEHLQKAFYPALEAYITSDKAYGMIIEGNNAISIIRSLVQRDKSKGLQPGDIRYDIADMLNMEIHPTKNVVHASDKPESAEREIAIFEELLEMDNIINL